MANKNQLVLQHLEDISGQVLAEDRDVVRELIKGKAGVYALYKRERLYYVGLATNLMGRLNQHLKDRHKGRWDRFSVYLTVRDGHIRELESLLLRIVNPHGNRMGGRFVASKSLRPALAQMLKEKDDDRRAVKIGGPLAIRRRRARAKRTKGSRALKHAFDRRVRLWGEHGGKDYFARLHRDGSIACNGYIYDSPSAASRDVAGARAGWNFWHFYDRRQRVWKPLASIRR